ncbi:MAG: hypothetical protein H0U49_05335, partial [Parachlamydiaceae bacterium]|nr:hypothetical protein [Parachlamydiaceae bacterium]
MSSPPLTINNQNINQSLLSSSASMQEELYASGKKFVKFIGKNVLNLTGVAVGTALLVNQWYVSGVALLTFTSYNIFSNAAASQTWIPRGVRQFIVDKGGFIFGVATGIAFIATQSHILGISLLIYSSYRLADNLGFVPRNISLFMERLFPWRVLPSCVLVEATPIGVINFFSLFANLRPVERFIYEKADLFIHKLFDIDAPTIQEIAAPYVSKPSLSFGQMQEILNGKDSDYTLDVRHCSRSVTDIVSLEDEDRHFEKLLEMSKSTNWSSLSKDIFSSKSFLLFLSEEFPDIDMEEIKKHPDVYADKLAMAQGMTGSAYAEQWLKKRFEKVVNLLNGRIACRVKGLQSELDDAIIDTAKILPYLEKINKQNDPIHKMEA